MAFVSRLAVTAGLLGGAAWFLVLVGAPTARLHADVIGPLTRAAGFVSGPTGGDELIRRAFVNGQPFQYVVGASRLPARRVLDHYERQFRMPEGRDQLPGGVSRIDGADAGVVVGVSLGPVLRPDWLRAPSRESSTVTLGDLARIHVVTAYGKPGGSTYLDFRGEPGARLATLLPQGDRDAPGTELPGIGRPPGARGVFAIEHGEGPAWSRTVIFVGRSLGDFRTAFATAGWTLYEDASLGGVIHMTNGVLEAFLGGGRQGTGTIVIAVIRPTGRQSR